MLLCTSAAVAQTPAELANGSQVSPGDGPSLDPLSGRFLLNPSGTTYSTPTTTVRVTGTISNQQYTGVGTGTGSPVLMFGATNTTGGTNVTPRPKYAAMTDVGSPSNGQYSNAAGGGATGIDVATNLAFNMYTSVRHWASLTSPSTTSRIHMADLTFTFSTPLTNPYIHVVGMGATSGSLGFSTELTLLTPGLSLTRLQGNTPLSVTATQINNGISGIGASCATNVAGCGTIRLNGSNIQTVSFRVYVRGNGGTSDWGSTANHAGDQWLMAFSIPETFTLSGNVFSDNNGLSDNTVNGTGTGFAASAQLYAILVETASGTVLGSTPVNADGTYSVNGIPAGAQLRVEVTVNPGTPLSTAPVRELPNGWIYTGENVGAGPGSDGTPDGAQPVTVNGNVSNVNFGVRSLASTTAPVMLAGRVVNAEGRGVSAARILLQDAAGNMRLAMTNPFGFYRFDDLTAGETVVLTVSDKRHRFDNPTQVRHLTEDFLEANFIAN
jgi:hypothetical protein